MANGTVKWFNDSKGFGFIANEDGSEAFATIRPSRVMALRVLPRVRGSALILKRARKDPRRSTSLNCNRPGGPPA